MLWQSLNQIILINFCCFILFQEFVFLYTTFMDYFADVFAGIKKEVEAGSLPANVAAGMQEVYNNYKSAVSFYSRASCTVIWTFSNICGVGQILVHSLFTMKLNFTNDVFQAYCCLSSLSSILVSLVHTLTQFIIILVFGALSVAVLMMVLYVGKMLITWLSIPITYHGYSKC